MNSPGIGPAQVGHAGKHRATAVEARPGFPALQIMPLNDLHPPGMPKTRRGKVNLIPSGR